ncbi:MAG: exonuclease SbcCD subunit D [Methanobacteriota archaeon]|nr:MAG: exonuclease SbcCD subunit D [Euryarchaeota archaeon]
MRIAVLSDTHLGHRRFYAESFAQLESSLKTALAHNPDIIIHPGDMFDNTSPSLDSLNRAYSIFSKFSNSGVPIYAIAGNHEKLPRDMANPVEFLGATGCFNYLHNTCKLVGEVAFVGMNYLPEDKAKDALELIIEREKDALSSAKKRVLVIHQNIKDYAPGEGLTKKWLNSLPFDLILNGHIHKRIYEWPIILPGSTLTTKINEEEVLPRGITVIDLASSSVEFKEIEQKPFFYKVLEFDDGKEEEIREAILSLYSSIKGEKPDAIIKIKLKGSTASEKTYISLPRMKDLYVDNDLVYKKLEKAVEEWKASLSEKKDIIEASNEELVKELSKKMENAEEFLSMLYTMEAEDIVKELLREEQVNKEVAAK